MMMELIEGSETSVIRTKTPENHPNKTYYHICPLYYVFLSSSQLMTNVVWKQAKKLQKMWGMLGDS